MTTLKSHWMKKRVVDKSYRNGELLGLLDSIEYEMVGILTGESLCIVCCCY